MGNCVSEDAKRGHKEFLKSSKHDPNGQQFRVYLHRRNKIVHAWLRITLDEIFLEKSKTDVVSWPLQLIRRYGYTSAGVFFFESGRRCRTGEGLHCFQTQNADIIFQIVQQRIQDNANSKKAESMGMARQERAHSSGPAFHSGVGSHQQHRGGNSSRINPIQRFGSEGGGVGSDYLSQPSGYNSYHQGSQATKKLRKVVLPPPPPRPRSVGGEDEPAYHLPPASFHPHRQSTSYDHRIVGNIVSESSNPSALDDDMQSVLSRSDSMGSQLSGNASFRPPYVNISPLEVLPAPRARAESTSSRGSQMSAPPTPTRTVFPLRWDVGAGSTSMLCYTQPTIASRNRSPQLASPPAAIDSSVNGLNTPFRYVNVSEVGGRYLVDRDHTVSPPPRLNYADVSPNELGERERVPSRCSSIGQRSDIDNGIVNYTLIDAEKTRALQAAAATNDDRNGNSSRRRHLTGNN